MPPGTPAKFIEASLKLFDDTGHHVRGVRVVWAEGQSDPFAAFDQALKETDNARQAASQVQASLPYRALGFEVSEVTIEPILHGEELLQLYSPGKIHNTYAPPDKTLHTVPCHATVQHSLFPRTQDVESIIRTNTGSYR